jgi:hypothetical protein
MPSGKFSNRLRKTPLELEHDEAFHPRISQNQVEVIFWTRPEHSLWIVVLRDTTTEDNVGTVGDPIHDCFEDLAADIIKVDIDAVGT